MIVFNSIRKARKAMFLYFKHNLQQKRRNMMMKILRDIIRIRIIITQIPSKSLSKLFNPNSPKTFSIVTLFSLFYT